MIRLPISQLTDIRHYLATRSLLGIVPIQLDYMDRCTGLTELHLVSNENQCFSFPAVICLESLCSLHISDSHIVNYLNAPRLKALYCATPYDDMYRSYHDPIYFECNDAPPDIHRFLSGIHGFSPSWMISRTKVADCYLRSSIAILCNFLLALELRYVHWTSHGYVAFDEGLRRHLIVRHSEIPVLTHLQSFSVLINNISHDADGDLASFVNYDFYDFIARRTVGFLKVMTALKQIKVDIKFPMPLASMRFSMLRDLKEKVGLDISIASRVGDIPRDIRVGRFRKVHRVIYV